MKKIILLLLSSFFFSSCLVLLYGRYGREPLIMVREDLKGNSLKINGFYHYQEGKRGFINVVFFKNGVFFVPYATPYPNEDGKKDVKKAEDYFKTITKTNNPYHDIVYAWGLFNISGNDLTIETWMSGDGGNKYLTHVFESKILNDSTLVIPKGFINSLPDTFHFVKTSIKPDSTCPFIPY